MAQPGKLQAIIDALRNTVGMGNQQSPGPATDALGSYRQYVMQAQEAGQPAMSLQEWQNSQQPQQMPVSSPQ